MNLKTDLYRLLRILPLVVVGTFLACKQKPIPNETTPDQTPSTARSSASELSDTVPQELTNDIEALLAELKQQEAELAAREQALQRFQEDLNEQQLRLANLQAELRSKEIELVEREKELLTRQESLQARQSSMVLQRRLGLLAFGVGTVMLAVALVVWLRTRQKYAAVSEKEIPTRAPEKSSTEIRAEKEKTLPQAPVGNQKNGNAGSKTGNKNT